MGKLEETFMVLTCLFRSVKNTIPSTSRACKLLLSAQGGAICGVIFLEDIVAFLSIAHCVYSRPRVISTILITLSFNQCCTLYDLYIFDQFRPERLVVLIIMCISIIIL